MSLFFLLHKSTIFVPMKLLDLMPLLATLIGTVLLVFVLFRKSGLGKNKLIRYVLASLIFIHTFTAFDHYLTISTDGTSGFYGMSYLFVHLIGFLFYYFVVLFTKTNLDVKKWLWIVAGYTLIRWMFFYPLFEYENLSQFLSSGGEETEYNYWFELEYLITSVINIVLIFAAYFRLKKAPLVLNLDDRQSFSLKWVKLIFVTFVVLQMGVLAKDLIASYTVENYQAYMKIETLMISIFFFAFAYSIMHFPVFAFSGDFDDLPQETKQKYAKSSLTDSSVLFQEIHDLVAQEKLYLDYDLKLNTVAEKLDKSIHHISQAINQSSGKNFPDFINGFRIEAAKKKLLEPKPDTIYAISLDVGFNSKAAFYTAFKKATSHTPTAFKQAHKNNV